jgi:hypothetical protein
VDSVNDTKLVLLVQSAISVLAAIGAPAGGHIERSHSIPFTHRVIRSYFPVGLTGVFLWGNILIGIIPSARHLTGEVWRQGIDWIEELIFIAGLLIIYVSTYRPPSSKENKPMYDYIHRMS